MIHFQIWGNKYTVSFMFHPFTEKEINLPRESIVMCDVMCDVRKGERFSSALSPNIEKELMTNY